MLKWKLEVFWVNKNKFAAKLKKIIKENFKAL